MRLDPDCNSWTEGDTIFFDFPGTDGWVDCRNNLRAGMREVYGCKVNRADRQEALATIRKYRQDILGAKNIVVLGHSRGGAVALQFVFELLRGPVGRGYLDKGYRVCVTAAKPTGDREFYKKLDFAKAHRRRGDIVPFLPPWSPNVRHEPFGSFSVLAHQVKNYRAVREEFLRLVTIQ